MALLVAVGLGALPEEQLECEQAMVHLLECCQPESTDVCGGGCAAAVLTLDESACIEGMSCEEMAASNVCDRVSALANVQSNTPDPEHAAVCP